MGKPSIILSIILTLQWHNKRKKVALLEEYNNKHNWEDPSYQWGRDYYHQVVEHPLLAEQIILPKLAELCET